MIETRQPIILVITHLPQGGAQRVVLTLAEGLDRKRFEVHLVAGPCGGWVNRAKKIENCHFHPVPSLVRELSPKNDLRVIPDLYRIFHRIRMQHRNCRPIVHTHAPKAGMAARLAARLAGCVPLHTLHGFPFHEGQSKLRRGLYKALESLGYLAGGEVISVTETNRRKVIEQGWATPENVTVIPPSVDLERLSGRKGPRVHLARHGIGEQQRVIGMVASLKPPKDPFLLARAASEIIKENKDVRLVFAGGGEMRPALENELQRLEIAGQCVLLDWFDPIEELYPELDILVLPSYSEGLPLVLIEARACGVPVIANKVGGIGELIRHNENGILLNSYDPNELCDHLRSLLNDPKRYSTLREQAFKGLECYSPKTMIASHEALYLRLCSTR